MMSAIPMANDAQVAAGKTETLEVYERQRKVAKFRSVAASDLPFLLFFGFFCFLLLCVRLYFAVIVPDK